MTRTSLVALGLAVLCFAAAPSLASAADESKGSRAWLATDADGGYGRLALQGGHLAFHSMHGTDDWNVDLADAKRIEVSKTANKVVELETTSGEKFVFTILDSHLMTDSPRKALQAINVAFKSAGKDRRRLTATAVPTPAPAGSVKVVGVNGGQIR